MFRFLARLKKPWHSSKFVCSICFDDIAESGRFTKGKCDHTFCVECVSKYVDAQLQQNIIKVVCPIPKCSMKLKPKRLRGVLPDEVIVRWESAECESSIATSEKIYCAFKDCSVLLVDDGRKFVTSVECPSCHRLFCAQCKVPWHGDKSCKEVQSEKGIRYDKKLDDKFFTLARLKRWQKCPNCNMFVQRSSGCEHIKCRCGYNFCYMCGKKCGFGHICR